MWTQQQQQQAYLRASLPSQHPQQQTLHPGIMGTDEHVQQQQQHHHHHHQHHHHHHQHHQHQHHRPVGMDVPGPSNPRASRNMAEKQRRDNLNTNISTMAALVPTVSGSSRRMDKISILRLAAAFLRTDYTLGRGSVDFLPRPYNDFDLEEYFLDNLIGSSGFFVVLTTTGKIVYVSRQVEQQLGHAQNELLGQSLYNFVYAEDHEELTRNLTPDELQPAIASSSSVQITEATSDNNSNSSDDSTSGRNGRRPFHEQRRSFKLRMSQRTVSRREHTQYETLHVSGILRLADACKNLDSNPGRSKHRDINSTSNDIVFVGMAKLPKKRPITELSIIDANKDEYVTRHLVDGRIIYCDHRVSVVAGYLSEEVSGLSAFSFMHKDDFRWTMIGLRRMYDRAETYGTSCYRLLSKTGEFIYLRTHGYLEFDKDTQTVESFVCINTLVSEEEGIELVNEMKERYSATVSGTTRAMIQNGEELSFDLGSDSQQSNSKSNLEDPSQLEDAITHLISDLPSPAVSEDRLSPSPMPNAQFAKAAIFSQRLPPAATQASKIGIKKIDHYLVLQGKENRTPKPESRTDAVKMERSSVNPKSMDPTAVEEQQLQRISESEASRPTGKPLALHELMKREHEDTRNESEMPGQIHTLDDEDVGMESHMSIHDPGNSGLSVAQTPSVLNMHESVDHTGASVMQTNISHGPTTCKVKVEHAIDMLNQIDKREPVLGYLENGVSDGAVVSSDSESGNHYALKRMCSDQDLRTVSNKRRHSEMGYSSSKGDNGQQGTSYVSRNFVNEEEFSGLSAGFNQYNQVHPQSVRNVDSSSSSLREVNVDYQPLDPSVSLVISNPEDEQFGDLQDLKDDALLSPDLDANPDLMMKIFDDLRPVMGFEKTFDDVKVEELTATNQAMSDKIKRTHLQLANSMTLRESQFDVIARDLEGPAFQAQRENLNQLQAEHKMQKQMLKTLQQDHHNIQVNVKHNIGV